MKQNRNHQVLELVKKAGVLRPRDLDPHGIPREYLRRLQAQGRLKRLGRGLYALPDHEVGGHHSLAEACKRIPKGVVCLLSALRFHDLTTQAPFEVWLALDEKAWRPQLDYPPLKIVRFSKEALDAGVKKHIIEGVAVHVTNPAKTVVDCFKYRNKIGLDVALEALRECWNKKCCTMDALWKYAGICRVKNIIRPYLETLS